MIPEGWGYEGPDTSVGIFGEVWWHEACPVSPDGTDDYEAVHESKVMGESGEGGNHVLMVANHLTCLSCGATATWDSTTWDPLTT